MPRSILSYIDKASVAIKLSIPLSTSPKSTWFTNDAPIVYPVMLHSANSTSDLFDPAEPVDPAKPVDHI